jgi:hypothetical protein
LEALRNALDKSERKEFDNMFDIPRLYLASCSNAAQLVPLHPIIMSILFHHYKELTEIFSEVEQIEAKVNARIREGGQSLRPCGGTSDKVLP